MHETEWRGPYHITRNGDLRVIRCNKPFVAVRVTVIHSAPYGKDYMSRPFVLNPGDKLTIKGEGLPEEVVEYGGGAA